ncbi:MAG: SDR family oxidoreductase [Phycisphaerae bacterium]|nr:SDR family oxidoreductase [Phycisphaerae bacterium]
MKKNRRMLITGVSGLLGNNLAYCLRDKFEILGLYLEHPVAISGIRTLRADLLSENSFEDIIHEFAPDILIHCASLTNVDFCETNRDITDKVNVIGTKNMVESLRHAETKLVYISTDSVYDGIKGNFAETDAVKPQNYYGVSKYKGELEVLKRNGSLIIRTNIFGWNIQEKFSIAEWIMNELSNDRSIKGFKDAFFSSIYTFDLAKILLAAVERNLSGVFNCGSRTSTSKYEFALQIAGHFKLNKDLIQPISIADFDFKAKRGKNLSLDVNHMRRELNVDFPTIKESVQSFFSDYEQGIPQKIKHLKPDI